MQQQAPELKRRPQKPSTKASPSPQFLIKAYRSNQVIRDNDRPDLTISPDPTNQRWFVFGGADAQLFSGFVENLPDPKGRPSSQPWRYERLEVYANGSELTFVMPTVSSETKDNDDKIFAVKPPAGPFDKTLLIIHCHMHLLDGEYQKDRTKQTPFALKMSTFRGDGGTIRIFDAQLGRKKKWGTPIDFSKFGIELSDAVYKEDLKGTPGPLLQLASISDFDDFDDTLEIQLKKTEVKLDRDHSDFFPTFCFTFKPDLRRGPLNLMLPGAAKLSIPLHASTGTYQITQRAADNWLERKSGEEWSVEFDCDGFDDLWKSSLAQYRSALATVRPINRVTLIPSVKTKAGPQFNLRLSLLIIRNSTDAYAASPEDLSFLQTVLAPPQPQDAVLTLDLGDGRTLDYSAKIDSPGNQPNRSFTFSATLATSPPGQTNPLVRIGSLDLEFGATANVLQQRFQLLDLSTNSPTVPRMTANMQLPVASITPGGQDGLPSSEYVPEYYQKTTSRDEACMERRFTGGAPVVIPVGEDGGTGSYLLQVDESNPDLYSQTIFLQLDYIPENKVAADAIAAVPPASIAPQPLRVVVVDSDPFLVAAVDYFKLQPSANSNTVALWNTGELGGAAWQLQTDAQPFSLILPPQGIGEEMPKGTELDAKDQNSIQRLDFRFSPAARQILQASYTPQNFTDAPWNLRRILGYPGQRDAGAGVVQLNYELLYGLSCSVDHPLLRLAEVFSLIGRIAGRVPRFDKWDKSDAPIDPKDSNSNPSKLYQTKRWNWSLYAELYSKRVAFLEPRSSGSSYGASVGVAGASAAPEDFTLSQGVQCTFRGSADLYYSIDSTEIAKVDDDTFPISQHPRTALKGGVSWPFESPRLFHATVRNPKSSSAVVNALALSPLGGTGTVKAGFDKDLSTITSVTEIGRSSKVSVARLGRIGVFHNLARYVIEYERDTAPSQQFQASQTKFLYRPVLRKVREFVEILEPIATLSNSAQAYPGGGCVKSIEFKQRIIPVKGAWSANVGDNGWKIPLWYEPDKDSFYKLPSVVFNMAGADGADVECAIKSVDKLFFYTETDANADSDPHNWPIVSSVDFLSVPLPACNPAFTSNNLHEIPAYDPPTPFGLATFTHQLDEGHGRVNLVNGRSAQAIGSNLASVTLQRGPQVPPQLQKDIQVIHDMVRGDLFTAIRTNLGSPQDIAKDICNQAVALAKPILNKVDALAKAVGTQEQVLLQNYVKQMTQEVNLVADELKAQIWDHGDVKGKTIDAAKATIVGFVKIEVNAFKDRLDGLPVSANALPQFFLRICETLTNAKQGLADRQRDLQTALTNASITTSHDAAEIEKSVSGLKQALSGPIGRINSLLTQVRTQVQSRAENWMPGADLVCHNWEDSVCSRIALVQTVLSRADTLLAYANSGADDQIDDARKAVDAAIGEAKTAVLNINFTAAFLDNNVVKKAKEDAQVLQAYLKTVPAAVEGKIDQWITDAASQANITVITGVSEVKTLVDAVAQKILTLFDVTGALKPTQDQIAANANAIASKFQDYVKNVTNEVCQAVTKLQGAAVNELEAARRTLEDALGRMAESIAHAMPPIDIQLPSGASIPVLLNRAFGSVPAIPNLGFSLPNAAYFYGQLAPNVNLTPILTKIKDLVPNLSPLSTLVPSFALSDRVLPVPNLPKLDLSNIFPDFAGLKLDNLFPSLKMPAGSNDAVKITHGLDTTSRTAWVQADIDLKTDSATIFSVGPMALQIVTPRFTAQVRAQAGANGQVSKQATGFITGDWQLLIGGAPMITLTATSLSYDKDGKLHVDVSPDRVQLSSALSFVQQVIALYSSPDSGFGIYPSATGIETRLSLPIPDTSLGTSGITNLTFNFLFGLSWGSGFELYAGFGLASPNAPFNISVFILGGGGHLVATARYTPGKSLTCQVDMALDASAALAIALGPIRGSVHVNLGMRFVFNSGQGDLSLGIFLLIGGEVSILSIVSANILLRLDATYQNGAFSCRGLFSISIKICWCFTLDVHEEVSCRLGSGGGLAYNESLPFPWAERSDSYFALDASSISSIPPQSELDNYAEYAVRYLQLIN
jgi:hypothetical protein